MEHTDISLFSHPIKTIYIFGIIVVNYILSLIKFILNKWYLFLLLGLVAVGPRFIEGSHT
jgi:vacuole membrane protein 1